MNVHKSAYLDAIEARIQQRHLLNHPFYQAWTRGELSLAALREYAGQYYHHVAAFPTYLSALHSNVDDLDTRRHILANLMDEEAGSPNHPELWLQFAEAIGVHSDEVRQTEFRQETRNLISAFRSVCREKEFAAGIAALYAYESQIPAVAESKIEGLKKFYGINSPEGLAYFSVHLEADKEHSAVERKLLEKHINEGNAAPVTEAVDEVLMALWEMLSGICRRHGIAC